MAACGFEICAAPARNDTSPCFHSIADATAEHEGAPRRISARCVTKRQQRAILRRPALYSRRTCPRRTCGRRTCGRFASRYPGGRLQPWASAAKRGRKPISENGQCFLLRCRRASARHCSHHGSSPCSDEQRFFGQELDEQLCCREHDPRYEQGRACKKQDVIEDSGHDNSPCALPHTSRRAGAGRRRDGDTSNLAHNARRFGWFPTGRTFFWTKFSSVS